MHYEVNSKYLGFTDYLLLGGVFDEPHFAKYSYMAEKKIDKATNGRIKNATEAVEWCIVRLIELLDKADISKDRVASFSNDGVSQTVVNVELTDFETAIDNTICEYLSGETDENGIPLLYLGVD